MLIRLFFFSVLGIVSKHKKAFLCQQNNNCVPFPSTMQLKQVITKSIPVSQNASLECLFCLPHLTSLTCVFILLVPLQ